MQGPSAPEFPDSCTARWPIGAGFAIGEGDEHPPTLSIVEYGELYLIFTYLGPHVMTYKATEFC